MNSQRSPSNKLFFICPSSHLENFIRQHFGNGTYYLTALSSVFDFREILYVEAIADFLRRMAVREIYLTQDTANIFMQNMLDKQPGFGTPAEKTLFDLLINNYSGIMQHSSQQERLNYFASVTLQHQAKALMANALLQQAIFETGASVKGLLINRAMNQMKEIILNPTETYK